MRDSRWIVSAAAALALHAALALFAWRAAPSLPTRAATAGRPAPQELVVELEAADIELVEPSPTQAAEPTAASSSRNASLAATRGAAPSPALEPGAKGEPMASASPASSASPPGPASARKRPIDLGLGGGVTRGALLAAREHPGARYQPSVGWLSEGLAELDAQRGLSRSSAALSAAASAAASFAPVPGLATFDVLTDREGRVMRVTVVQFDSSGSRWQQVARRMEALLRKRRLRVPPGARGLQARLSISTGALAEEPPSHRSTKRAAAVAQEGRSNRDTTKNESTQAIGEIDGPPTPSPTMGTTVAGGSNHPRVRVALIREQVLN